MGHDAATAVAEHLEGRGFEVVRCGAVAGGDTPWPVVAEEVARLVAQGAVDTAVLCCWTGTGVSIAANKVPGVRAALCGDAETARGARRWNDANLLALAPSASSSGATGCARERCTPPLALHHGLGRDGAHHDVGARGPARPPGPATSSRGAARHAVRIPGERHRHLHPRHGVLS
ncbi:MAG: RpiB/LacA/LacB family sugar-phosphate isomerase [Chloroflexi bacterium]|nr:MAG: RpiB/LacA/LacB family sugar-phosphate isomerase [Chloroflexota bacterium]